MFILIMRLTCRTYALELTIEDVEKGTAKVTATVPDFAAPVTGDLVVKANTPSDILEAVCAFSLSRENIKLISTLSSSHSIMTALLFIMSSEIAESDKSSPFKKAACYPL